MKKLLKNMLIALSPTILVGILVIIVDPEFHYHAPIKGLAYCTEIEPRWSNDGINKHFNYNALVTGTSLDENLDIHYFESEFQTVAVKNTYAAGRLAEICYGIRIALEHNPDCKMVMMSLGYGANINSEYDQQEIEGLELPYFMYDKNPFNDMEYVFNLKTLNYTISCFQETLKGNEGFDFNQYEKWGPRAKFGQEYVLNGYNRKSNIEKSKKLSDDDVQRITKNLQMNLIQLAKDFPNTTFYYYLPPRSIVWWDSQNREGNLECMFEEIQIIIEQLLDCPNIKLFNFVNDMETVENLDNYKDTVHYGEWINNKMIHEMSNDVNLITNENYLLYMDSIRKTFKEYEYDAYFIKRN